MATEIERKFLPKDDRWRTGAQGQRYRQGYLVSDSRCTVRVRTVGDKGFLTVKGISVGPTRAEYEYPIPLTDADEMLASLCQKPLIEKQRYQLRYRGMLWEIDEFFGDNQGLVVAEVELQSADQPLELPEWAGQEVTADPRYFNANLAQHPFKRW